MFWDRLKYLLHELCYPLAAVLGVLAFSARVKGGRHVPRNGGLLIIANHQSYLDPPVVGLAVRRHVTYLARKQLFGFRPFAWLIQGLGAIPIYQEASGTEGIKAALAQLKKGKAIVVFPEGGRARDGAMQPFRPGVVLLVRRAKVPILPVGLGGLYRIWPPHQLLPHLAPVFGRSRYGGIAAVVGEPIDPDTLVSLPPGEMLSELSAVVAKLHHEAERLRRKEW